MLASIKEGVQDHLWNHAQDGARIYTILDGARDDRIYPNVKLSGTRSACLYRGKLPEVLASAAPHLVELRPNLPFLDWLLRFGWGNSWGIFLSTPADIDALRTHFRRFLTVQDESGRQLYFRYYDPRVLRTYLPTCMKEEQDFVFGPVDHFLLEAESPDRLASFVRRGARLETTLIPL